MTGATLYERLGGEAAVMAAVDLFYRKVLANDVTKPFFEGLDMTAQISKQIAFMTWAFGGPLEQRGRDLRTAHAKLVREKGLADRHFDVIARLLEETLLELGVERGLVDEVLHVVGGTRSEVLAG